MNNSDEFHNAKILLVSGIGGHGEQLRRIRGLLPCKKVTVLAEPNLKWDFNDDFFYATRVVDYHDINRYLIFVKFLKVAVSAIRLLKKKNIDLIISTGPAMSVPVCLVGKVMGVKVVHVESWSRINSISNSTKIILRFNLAHVVVYQYRDSILAGHKKCEFWGHL